ncbi:r2 protein [Lasius niger]|uniref:R2 protein n=1 Tax=Lasius niger TaxID=67767 RepID=A0A0J7K7K8_LASNI|nr:r2 protein [Lasius niger]
MNQKQPKQAPEADIQLSELYIGFWGTPGPQQEPVRYTATEIPAERILLPITSLEVKSKIKCIANSSAAGIDKIKKANLKDKGTNTVLAKLFNLLLLKGIYPVAWKQNRSTLIPKGGKDPAEIIRRVFQQTQRQKGFTSKNGCFANTRLLSAAVSEAKASGGVFTVLDISKAFDTVPHQAINLGLKRKGIPPTVANYITNMYNGCKTIIKAKDGEDVPIELKRRVKQGDPLSPLLFNLVIEPIIQMVQDASSGIQVEGSNLAAMAFADDMILLAKDRETAIGQIKMVYTELRKREMVVGGIPILYGEPDKAFKYLGVSATPWKGLIEGIELNTIQDLIDRVKTLPIKPMQKLTLLRTYLLPRFTYGNKANKLKRNLNVPEARVVPIVVSSRGALPAATIAELKQL